MFMGSLDFGLTKELVALRDLANQFATKEIKDIAHSIDQENEFPNQLWEKMGNAGLLGVTVSEDFGGAGLGYLAHCIIVEEISRASASVGLSYGAHSNLCVNQIFRCGNELQKEKFLPDLISAADNDMVKPLQAQLEKQFKNIYLSSKVTNIQDNKDKLSVTIETKKESFVEVFDKALIAVGRKPNTDQLNIKNTDVFIEKGGFIPVNEYQQTTVDNIYAIGDITGNPMLAHKATHQGKVAAEVCAGKPAAFDVEAIPSVVYTDPELAWVGLTEKEAKEKNIPYEKGEFPWAASGRATAVGSSFGKTKILFSPERGKVLGVGIVGVGAGDIISEAVLAIEMGVDAEDLSLTVHPHPTLGETIGLAGEVFTKTITDLYIQKK